jgi:RAD3-like DEAD/DEAH box helicase
MPRRPQKPNRRASSPRPSTSSPKEFRLPDSTTPALPAVEDFADLDMPAGLLKTLTAQGVTTPFPIQAATLPNSLAGRDLLGRGRTGSGKTLAFGLALLARTAGLRAQPKAPLALVLVPTRELAQQVADALTPYATAVNLRLATVVGGLSITKQAGELRRGAEVLVATPGRLNDLLERGDCALGDVRVTVLDEADQMTDMGFLPQITKLIQQVRPDGQRMLFSATLDRNIDRLVQRFLTDPVVHSVDPSAGAVTTMEHHVLHVQDETDKKAVTTRIAARDGRVIPSSTPRGPPTASPSGSSPSVSARRHCTEAAPSHSATAPWSSSGTARSPRWWRPTSRPGASTSTISTSSSMSIPPPTTRTTSTAAAARPAPAAPAAWSPWSCPTRNGTSPA